MNKNMKLMKKSYLLLAAGVAILASCSNENVLYDVQNSNEEVPTVIGFSNYAVKPTKATANDLEYYHETFAVYATKVINGETEVQYVFGANADATNPVAGTTCTYVDGTATNPLFYESNWEYENERYWDSRAKYDFIAYAPAAAPIKFQYATATSEVDAAANKFVSSGNVELYGQNLQDGNQGTDAEKMNGFTESSSTGKKDIDIMVSNLLKDKDGRDYVRTAPRQTVNLEFHHILSKLNVRIAKDKFLDDVTVNVKSVEIDGLKHIGVYGTTANKWTAADRLATSTYTLSFNTNYATDPVSLLSDTYITELPDYDNANDKNNYKYFIESIVMPQELPAVCNLKIRYEIISGSDPNNLYTEQYVSVTDISDTNIFTNFVDRYNYTLSVIIQPNVITFDASAAAWDYAEEQEIIIARPQ